MGYKEMLMVAMCLSVIMISVHAMELIPQEMHTYIASYVMETDDTHTLSEFNAWGTNRNDVDKPWSCNKAWTGLGFMQNKPIKTQVLDYSFPQMVALSPEQRIVLKRLYHTRKVSFDPLSKEPVNLVNTDFHYDRSIYVAVYADWREQVILQTMPKYAIESLKVGFTQEEDVLIRYKYSLPQRDECMHAVEQLACCNPLPMLLVLRRCASEVYAMQSYVFRNGKIVPCMLEDECTSECSKRAIVLSSCAAQPSWDCKSKGCMYVWS